MNFITFYLLIIIKCSEHFVHSSLFYSAASVLQITSAFSAPIEIPGRKLYWDWGFQMNYDLPVNLGQFFNAPIWGEAFDDYRKRRDLLEAQYPDNQNNKTVWENSEKYYADDLNSGKHPSDFTAGELYHSLENLLLSYGFHETCLLRSVCELAHHPFADDHQNILSEVLTFILTPSLHEAFSESETMYREVYEEAELRGFLHYDCAELYQECGQDLLTAITNVITNTEDKYEN